jgi:hypothetical protein
MVWARVKIQIPAGPHSIKPEHVARSIRLRATLNEVEWVEGLDKKYNVVYNIFKVISPTI